MMTMKMVLRSFSVWLVLAVVSFRSPSASVVSASGVWKWDGTEESCTDVCGCRRRRRGQTSFKRHPWWKIVLQKCDSSCDCVAGNPACPKNPQGKPCETGSRCLEFLTKTFKPYYCEGDEGIITDPPVPKPPLTPTPKPTPMPAVAPKSPPPPQVTDKPIPSGPAYNPK